MTGVASLYNGGAGADPWTVLYAKYGWDGTGSMEAVSGLDAEGVTLPGSEYVAEQIFKEICSPLNAATGVQGTVWIYSGNGTASAYNASTGDTDPVIGAAWGAWGKANRAKSRKGDPANQHTSLQYPRYGWAWLLNRRVFYNNGEVPGDVADVFVAPGYLARLWCIGGTNTLADWSWLYRAYNQLSDWPDVGTSTGKHLYPGRFPAFTEPYESPYDGGTVGKANLVAVWGRNTAGTPAGGAGTRRQLIMSDSLRGTSATYPLVLTTIRCVEHFQGGPITRNNAWNVELEPEPWIEINSVDAIKYGIKDGDYVNVVTARGNSTTDQSRRTIQTGALSAGAWGKGFKARVGVGGLDQPACQRMA